MKPLIGICLAVFLTATMLMPAAAAVALPPKTTYSCADGLLSINKSGMVGGVYVDHFTNETCSGGCAANGEECNTTRNVDKFGIAISAVVFLAAAAFFFVLSNNVKSSGDATLRVIKAFHTLKYLHLFLSFVCVLTSLLLLASMYTAGQNELTAFIMNGWLVILAGVLLTFLLLFFSEVDMWVNKLKNIGKRSI